MRRRWVADFEVILLAKILGVDVSEVLPKRIGSEDIPNRSRKT